MSENVTHPQDPAVESASGTAPALSTGATPAGGEPEHGIATTPMPVLPAASPPALPPEAYAMLELVSRGLAPDADESTRRPARDLWSRFSQLMTANAAAMPTAAAMATAPMMPAAPMASALGMPAAPGMPVAPGMPTTPIAMAARALRQMPPDQLIDLLLQRLRTALPPGTTVPMSRGIQFQLVPVPPSPTGSR